MRSLDEELAALTTMSSAQLRAEWQRLMRSKPPAISAPLMQRGLAYELQARRHGGLPPATQHEIERLWKELASKGTVALAAEPGLRPRTRLTRDWHGRTYHVLVQESGFLFEDRHYRSLSQIAHAITGTPWSGPRFFGLNGRKGAERGKGGERSRGTE